MEEVRALTPLFFQEALAEEIRWLTKDMRFRHPKNREFIPLRVHTQALPIPEKKKDKPADIDGLHYMDSTIDYINDVDEDAVFDCPWCLVKMNGGKSLGLISGRKLVWRYVLEYSIILLKIKGIRRF